jgi:hypothetical protein
MKTESLFRAEMQRSDGTRIRVEAWSYRTFVSKIRFFATVENARLLAREPIPENATCCTRCRDLFAPANGSHSAVCEECVEETVAGEESA